MICRLGRFAFYGINEGGVTTAARNGPNGLAWSQTVPVAPALLLPDGFDKKINARRCRPAGPYWRGKFAGVAWAQCTCPCNAGLQEQKL